MNSTSFLRSSLYYPGYCTRIQDLYRKESDIPSFLRVELASFVLRRAFIESMENHLTDPTVGAGSLDIADFNKFCEDREYRMPSMPLAVSHWMKVGMQIGIQPADLQALRPFFFAD